MTKIIITITQQQWGAMIEVADKAVIAAGNAADAYEKAAAVSRQRAADVKAVSTLRNLAAA